ncbi:MAG: ATP-grasp domain-containing protein [Alloprevotella sp.]|nr:ATP-grasp domain-containing protein [Alloprevotella sp.]
MAHCLAAAVRARGFRPVLLSYELSPLEPIAEVAEVIVGPRWASPDLMDHLDATVKAHGVNIILPFVDGAIAPAARYVASHLEVYSPCCSEELSDALFDKVASAALFEKAALDIPATFRPASGIPPRFPLIAKPRRGSASKGIVLIDSPQSLASLSSPDDYIIQEYIPEAEEVTVDCFISRAGVICALSPRRRLFTLGGEVARTVTIDSPAIADAAAMAINCLGLRGAVTLQYLSSPHGPLLMEINPRLGGGATASIAAGANIAAMIVDEALGLSPAPAMARPDTLTVRCFHDVSFSPDGNIIHPSFSLLPDDV